MPTSARDREDAADGRRADVAGDRARREVPGAELARARVEARELVLA